MELQIKRKGNYHTEEQELWAKEKIDAGILSQKSIRENNILEEYERSFGKKLTVAGMYSWLRVVGNPDLRLKKREYAKNNYRKSGNVKSIDAFSKSNYLLYINGKTVGFEDLEMVKAFIKDNSFITGDIKIFKSIPVKVEYSVNIGE